MKTVKTPCVGICSTVFGDEVCRGCKRFIHEVIDWNGYSNHQKQLVKNRLELLAEQVLTSKVLINDRVQFLASLTLAEISHEQSDPSLIIEFMRKAAKQIDDFSNHGLKILADYQHYPPVELKQLIDDEIHLLSTATYQKNFKSRYIISPSLLNNANKDVE